MKDEKVLRQHLVNLLNKDEAHMTFKDAVANFPISKINNKFPKGIYTPWHLLEHIRITQWDILDFIINPNYEEIEWPKAYWPPKNAKATKKDWGKTLKQYENDLNHLISLAQDPKTDLFSKIPWGSGQIVLREFLLVADHSAYHVGEFAIMRQTMGTWRHP